MFLRRKSKKVNGEDYEYWALVESVRTARGPRQRLVATLGKLPGLDKEEYIGWEQIRDILDDKERLKGDFFKNDVEAPEWASVKLKGVGIERMRQFGDVYLALLLWKKLKLDEMFARFQKRGKEKIEWDIMYCISTIARFCNPSSELEISESWYEKTALEDFVGVKPEKVNESRLYRTLDHILKHKDKVCKHLQKRYEDLFGCEFEFLIYDVTSTYFEGQCKKNPQAKYGYSRDHRSDCLQVCIGLVVTEEGLPIGYEVFDGNRNDVTTLEDMVDLMADKYGKANRVWVFDRGIVSEDNLEYLRERKAEYIVGSKNQILKKLEGELLLEEDWEKVEEDVEVKLVKHAEYGEETFILCRSERRKKRDRDIIEMQKKKLKAELEKIQESIKKGRLKNGWTAGKRLGRWMGRYARAEKLFDVELIGKEGELKDLIIKYKKENTEWVEKSMGSYVLRTNIKEEDPKKLWKRYVQLNQAESAFRLVKNNIGMRPVYHQTEDRVQAHIFICFLSLAMMRTLELWMDSKGLGRSPKKVIKEFQEIRSMDITLPVKNNRQIRLRVVSKPADHVKILLHRLGIKIPNRAKIIENVVPKMGH